MAVVATVALLWTFNLSLNYKYILRITMKEEKTQLETN